MRRAISFDPPYPALCEELRERMFVGPCQGWPRWKAEPDQEPCRLMSRGRIVLPYKHPNGGRSSIRLDARAVAWLLHTGRWPAQGVRSRSYVTHRDLRFANLTADGEPDVSDLV